MDNQVKLKYKGAIRPVYIRVKSMSNSNVVMLTEHGKDE